MSGNETRAQRTERFGHSVRAYRKTLSVLLFMFAIFASTATFADNALHKAIVKGKEAKALRIIRKGKGVEELTDSGLTPLVLAINRDQVDVFSALIETGVSLETRIGPSRFTVLHIAVSGGNFDAVKILVKAGANIEAVDAEGTTPWMAAVRRDTPEIAIMMLDGVKQPLSNESFEVAIRIASENGSIDILDRLLTDLVGYRPDLFQSDHLGYGQIHHLARVGRTDDVIAILEAGANVDLGVSDGSENQKGVSALWVALHNDHDALAEVLIQHGADPMLEGEEWSSPLQMQLRNGNVDLVDVMVAKSPGLRRSEFRDVESVANYLRSTMEPISMEALLAECGSPYQAIEGHASTTMVFNDGPANAGQVASKDFDHMALLQLPGRNIRTAIKVRSTDPDVTMVIRSQVSADTSFCEIYHVDGTYSAMLGTTGESRLVSVLVSPNELEDLIPFDAVIAYEEGVARHYYQRNGQWFEIQVD